MTKTNQELYDEFIKYTAGKATVSKIYNPTQWIIFDGPPPPTPLGIKLGKAKPVSKNLSLDMETITPHNPHIPVELPEENDFQLKKASQPNPLSNYDGLENVLDQLREMINYANGKGLTVPKMITRCFNRIFNLEEQVKYAGNQDNIYKSAYLDGFHDGKNNLSPVYSPDELPIDDPDV